MASALKLCREESSPTNGLIYSFTLTVNASTLFRSLMLLVCLLGTPGQLVAADDQAPSQPLRFWSQWRGPLANGVAPLANPPIEWSEKKNVARAIIGKPAMAVPVLAARKRRRVVIRDSLGGVSHIA